MIAGVLVWLGVTSVWADTLRIATFHAPFSRKGPGLLLRDLSRDDLPASVAQPLATIRAVDPDILLLTRFDYDAGLWALKALSGHLEYPYHFALKPNTGLPTGVDIDDNGKLGEARDAQGYGWFSGQSGLALLSRFPIAADDVTDFSALLWRDLPGSLISATDPAHDLQRLSTAGHWSVPLQIGNRQISVLAFAATPPVFDGPEDRNGRRNHDEIALWQRFLDGDLQSPPPDGPKVVLGLANLDPVRGEGLRPAIAALLEDSRLHPAPAHDGQATANWPAPGPGPLRVSYAVPSADLILADAGFAGDMTDDQPHRLVWIDVSLPEP